MSFAPTKWPVDQNLRQIDVKNLLYHMQVSNSRLFNRFSKLSIKIAFCWKITYETLLWYRLKIKSLFKNRVSKSYNRIRISRTKPLITHRLKIYCWKPKILMAATNTSFLQYFPMQWLSYSILFISFHIIVNL